MAYSVLRRWEGEAGKALIDLLISREEEVRNLITGIPGFLSYRLVRTDNGGFTLTECETREGTDESVRIAREWVSANVPKNQPVPNPIIAEGEVMLRFINPAAARQVLEQAQKV